MFKALRLRSLHPPEAGMWSTQVRGGPGRPLSLHKTRKQLLNETTWKVLPALLPASSLVTEPTPCVSPGPSLPQPPTFYIPVLGRDTATSDGLWPSAWAEKKANKCMISYEIAGSRLVQAYRACSGTYNMLFRHIKFMGLLLLVACCCHNKQAVGVHA